MQTEYQPAPDTQDDDDGFHDHALSELYRAADDLSPWYSAAELGEMILARARHVAYQPEESTRG